MAAPDQPSSLVIAQRVRNRLIEYLEIVAGYECDPPPWDLNETLNQWEDWNPLGTGFDCPPHTKREAALLGEVASSWDRLCDATPKVISDSASVFQSAEWTAFVAAAQRALSALNERGRLSEEAEESSGGSV